MDSLKDLDVILFNGQNYWFSSVVEWFTGSPYSHVGIVLKSPTYLDSSLLGTYLLESGSESTPDPLSHRRVFGVQLTDLSTLIPNYTGKVYTRPLLLDDAVDVPMEMSNIWEIIKYKPYDCSIFDLLRADMNWSVGNTHKTNKFFCSALVGYVYYKLGIMDMMQWDLLLPSTFAGNIAINNGSLGQIKRIK